MSYDWGKDIEVILSANSWVIIICSIS
jgi:hypothetical protein